MKRFLFIFIVLLSLSGCANKVSLDKLLDQVSIPTEIINLIEVLNLESEFPDGVTHTWSSSNTDVITADGIIIPYEEDQIITLTLSLEYKGKTKAKEFQIHLYTPDYHSLLEDLSNDLTLPEETSVNLNLPSTLGLARVTWTSSANQAISREGLIGIILNPTTVTLKATLRFASSMVTKTFEVHALPPSESVQLEIALASISFPDTLNTSLTLPSSFDYGVTGTWVSSNQDVMNNKGYVQMQNQTTTTSLTVTLETKGGLIMTHTFYLNIGALPENTVQFNGHLYKEMANTFDGHMNNVKLFNEKLILTDDALEGIYTSPIVQTLEYSELIGTWGALTGTTDQSVGTCELQIRVRVDNTWSTYFTYGAFGLGLENGYANQDPGNGFVKMVDDEIKMLNNKLSNAFQYRLLLKRAYLTDEFPVANFVAMALKLPNYTFEVDTSALPDFVDYDVPQLNQNIVPAIGNSICSPTSSTMLLKYKGHSFTHMDTFEHRYIAKLAKDYGHGIYGNWVYNCATMSSFGEVSYVKRLYSFEELFYHLKHVGPVATTVRGNMEGLYTTAGHLLVIRGYRKTESGTFIITNDPNLPDVYHEYSLTTFNVVWSKIIYVIE